MDEYEARADKDSARWEKLDLDATRREIKQHYIAEQQHLCCYCGLPGPLTHGRAWDVEHVVPKVLHPEFMFTPENLAVACIECNSIKSSKETLIAPGVSAYPSSGDDYLVVHPHFDEWGDHIIRDHTTYAAFTQKGRWTIKVCRLNRLAGRDIGLRYPISDARYEQEVRSLLDGGMHLQNILDQLAERI